MPAYVPPHRRGHPVDATDTGRRLSAADLPTDPPRVSHGRGDTKGCSKGKSHHGQKSKSAPLFPKKCPFCNSTLDSLIAALDHIQTKKHTKRIQERLEPHVEALGESSNSASQWFVAEFMLQDERTKELHRSAGFDVDGIMDRLRGPDPPKHCTYDDLTSEGVIPDRSPATLRIVTFNVWFPGPCLRDRTSELASLLSACDADVIGLQEVTEDALDVLRMQLGPQGWKLFMQDEFRFGYYTALLVRASLDVLDTASVSFDDTSMGRALQCILLDLPSHAGKLTVAVSHLESPPNGDTKSRLSQLRQGFHFLRDEATMTPAVWVGDMNWVESKSLPLAAGWSDAWDIARAAPGPTWHGNKGKCKVSDRRMDRVLIRGLHPEYITRLGTTTSMLHEGRPLYPSDHFGLFAVLRVSSPTNDFHLVSWKGQQVPGVRRWEGVLTGLCPDLVEACASRLASIPIRTPTDLDCLAVSLARAALRGSANAVADVCAVLFPETPVLSKRWIVNLKKKAGDKIGIESNGGTRVVSIETDGVLAKYNAQCQEALAVKVGDSIVAANGVADENMWVEVRQASRLRLTVLRKTASVLIRTVEHIEEILEQVGSSFGALLVLLPDSFSALSHELSLTCIFGAEFLAHMVTRKVLRLRYVVEMVATFLQGEPCQLLVECSCAMISILLTQEDLAASKVLATLVRRLQQLAEQATDRRFSEHCISSIEGLVAKFSCEDGGADDACGIIPAAPEERQHECDD